MSINLSICMMVKNEEANLEQCLNSLRILLSRRDVELIILDTGSTDETTKIAKRYTENVYYENWNDDFSEMRNKSISFAKGKWIFIMDADERLTNHSFFIDLMNRMNTLNKYNTIQIKLKNFFYKNNTDKFSTIVTPRFFKNNKDFKYVGSVHNQPNFKGPILLQENICLEHYGYIKDDEKLMKKKYKRTSELLKKELKKDPNNFYLKYQLSQTYGLYGKIEDALLELNSAYNLLNNDDDKRKRLYLYGYMASLYNQKKMFVKTIKICKEGIALNNEYIDLYYYIGFAYWNTSNLEQAYEYLGKFLKLNSIIEKISLIKDPAIEMHKVDIDSIKAVKLLLANILFSQKEYKKSLTFLKEISHNKNNNLYLLNLIKLNDYKEIYNIFTELNSTNQEKFITLIEMNRKNLQETEEKLLTEALSIGNHPYNYYNKLLISHEELEINEIKRLFNNRSQKKFPGYYYLFFNELIKNNFPVLKYLKKVNSEDLVDIMKFLFAIDSNVEYFQNLIKTDQSKLFDFQVNRVLMTVSDFILRNHISGAVYDFIFNKYLAYGKKHLNFLYQSGKYRIIYSTLSNNQEKFLMMMDLSEEAREQKNIKVAINYISEALEEFPVYAKFLKGKINELSIEFQKNYIEHDIDKFKHENGNLKVLHGPIEIANQMNCISNGLNRLNVESRTITYYPSYLGYNSDYQVDMTTLNKNFQKDTASVIVKTLIDNFDIFHFHYGKTLLEDKSDLSILKSLDKNIFMHHWGSDVRRLSIAKRLNPHARAKDLNELKIANTLEILGKQIDNCIVADQELYEYVKGFYNNIHIVRQAINLNHYQPDPSFVMRKDRPVIVHAPTSQDFKGTNKILNIITKLEQKYNFEFILVENMSHEEAKKIYQKADFIIDQLHGAGHGLFALEVMAMEKPVICHISEFMQGFYPKEIPIIPSNEFGLEKDIIALIKDPERRREIGQLGREYVKKYHDENIIASQLLDLYNERNLLTNDK
jgi:glycosyltransferase involved in cell wall biosynthesis